MCYREISVSRNQNCYLKKLRSRPIDFYSDNLWFISRTSRVFVSNLSDQSITNVSGQITAATIHIRICSIIT